MLRLSPQKSPLPTYGSDKPSIIGTVGFLFLLMVIVVPTLQLLFVMPMFINGMLTIEMLDLPHDEFSRALGTTGEAFFTFAELVALVICIQLILKSDNVFFKSLGFQFIPFQTDLFVGALAGAIAISVCFVFLVFTNNITFTIGNFHQVPWLASCLMFLAVSFIEEILCRGFIQGRLMRATGPYKALFISAIIFMLLHIGNPNWTFISLVNLALAGFTFGLYYLHTKNLWFPIGLHFTWNVVQGTVFGFEVSGTHVESWFVIARTNDSLITGGEFGLEGSILITIVEIVMIGLIYLKFSKKTYNV